MFSIMLIGGLLTAMAMVLFLHKFDIKKVLYFDKWIDLVLDIIIPLMFLGTLTGMMIAIISGLATSAYLHILKRKIGYKRPVFSMRRGMQWQEVAA